MLQTSGREIPGIVNWRVPSEFVRGIVKYHLKELEGFAIRWCLQSTRK